MPFRDFRDLCGKELRQSASGALALQSFLLSWVTLQLVHPFCSLFFCLPQSGVIPDSLEPAQIAAKKTQLTGSSLVTAVIGFYCECDCFARVQSPAAHAFRRRYFCCRDCSNCDSILARIFFFFNDTATTEIYTLSLHDALPIYRGGARGPSCSRARPGRP